MHIDSKEPGLRRGLAIVVVLAVLSLMGVLLVGLLGDAQVELGSSAVESARMEAERFADLATNLVISQIRRGADDEGRAWANQPGAIRSFEADGELARVFKLYSDEEMVATGAESLDADGGDILGWDDGPEGFVDLNRPVMRDGVLEFPVVDPRSVEFGVSGFEYEAEGVPGAVGLDDLPSDATDTTGLRLPMPVRWLYVLQDGTLGWLGPDGIFVGVRRPTRENPMVGRLGFWSDDECGKLNFNTASAPTYWDTPRAGSLTNTSLYAESGDRHYAKYQPAQREYQRYPGHPATTSLSPVFYPSRIYWGSHLSWYERFNNQIFKEAIYDITPNIVAGGSTSGTVAGEGGAVEVLPVRRSRRYASVDEMIFAPDREPNSDRYGRLRINEEGLRRIGFFVTAWSRAPELNVFGMPRVSIWPSSAAESGAVSGSGEVAKRTAFDELMRHCATVGADRHGYHFQRENPDSVTHDYAMIARNRELYRYLQRMTSEPIPGYGGDFLSKYGADRDQILTEIFDYIRSTNLYDDNLTPLRYTASQAEAFFGDGGYGAMAQYTRGRRTSQTGVWAGHGQVTPIQIGDTQGFGRFLTLSEVGVHFICNADAGGADPGDPGRPRYPDEDEPGESSGVLGSNVQANRALQPAPEAPFERLDWRKSERSVQAAFLFEFFCPAMGWTSYHGDYEVRVRVTRPFQVRTPENGVQELRFPADGAGRREIRSHDVQTDLAASGQMGGSIGFRAALKNREAPPMRGFRQESGHAVEAYTEDGYEGAYPFVSEPVYVDAKSGAMEFLGGELEVEIYSGRDRYRTPEMVQRIRVEFPGHGQMPVPELVTSGARYGGGPATSAEYWWSYHQDGIGVNPGFDTTTDASGNTVQVPNGGNAGRLRYAHRPVVDGSTRTTVYRPLNGAVIRSGDVVRTMVPRHGDYRLLAAKAEVWTEDWVPHPRYFGTAFPQQLGTTTITSNGRSYRVEQVARAVWLGHSKRETSLAHQFPGAWGTDQMIAYDRMGSLVPGIEYEAMDHPDFPATAEALAGQTRGDFDNGFGIVFDGPYINKPDEGNAHWRGTGDGDAPYFWDHPAQSIEDEPSFFAPNRQVPSPGMFGSLPTGVKAGVPWRTLLFRPQEGHEGEENPPDHLWMDLFWMPVVEPIALSEAFSTEGKVNLNYQIVPFTYLKRSTGVHALLRGEEVMAIPAGQAGTYKRFGGTEVTEQMRWPVDVEETLRQFEEKFEEGKLFRTASEICEIHLVPDKPGVKLEDMVREQSDVRYPGMRSQFWWEHRLTGDNSRERPYANIYPRATTQSNTYRIHVVAQSIAKARSSEPERFDPSRDVVLAEYRGSRVVERYLDPDMEVGDHATEGGLPSLMGDYRFRVINPKRFME